MAYDADTSKPDYNGEALRKEGAMWMERIRTAEKREDDWRKNASDAEKAFTNDTVATSNRSDFTGLYDFNILHSNVETIVPAIYNSTPVPDVRRRFVEALEEPEDPTPQIQQQMAQAAQQQLKIPPEQLEQFAQTEQGQQLQAQFMAQPQVKQAMQQYEQALASFQQKAQLDKDAKAYGDMVERAIIVQIDDNRLDKEIESEAQDSFLAGRGIVRLRFNADIDGDAVSNERIDFEATSWRDYRQGPAKRWDKVPWVAFRHSASRETLEAKVIDENLYEAQTADIPTTGPENDEDDIPYWEIWCKETKKVKFIREHDGHILKMVDDPLGLRNFFPNPQPVQPITLTGKMTPVCPFVIYQKLADELDTITKRINKIMKGLKVRGFVVGQAAKILDLQAAGDNELVMDPDLEGLAQTGGIEKAVLWWPVEQAIKVLAQLYEQREIVKASIYEITGISDIVRGASNANETLGAQEIKTQWGALRIQKMQRMIERQVRDLFGMMAEIISTKFSPETLYAMTGIEITEGMQALMQQPVLTSYRVDVESDSTVRADLTRVKSEMAEFMQGTGNYFNTMAPVVQASPEMAEPVTEIYSSFARVFKLGKQAEDALEKMADIAKRAAKNPPPNPEAEAMKMEQEAKAADREAEAVARQDEAKMKQAEFAMKEKAEASKEAREERKAQREAVHDEKMFALKERDAALSVQLKEKELQFKEREADLKIESKAAETALKLDAQSQSQDLKLDGQRQSNELAKQAAKDKKKEPA